MFQTVVKSAQLISLPEIYFKLKELIDDPEYTLAEVALLVGRDPGMATRFLRVVNNPLNRRIRKIETIAHAISMLGIDQVHDIVLSASIAEAFKGIKNDVMDMKKFWQRSFYCSVMSKMLAAECEVLESDRLFTMGLLYDIGHLFMYLSIPEESQNCILEARKLGRPLYQVQRNELGFDYAQVGSYVMEQWDLPKSFQVITYFHPEPGKATNYVIETALIHLSTLLAMSELEEGVFGEGAFAVDPTVWSTTALTPEQCFSIRETAADEYEEVENSIFL